MSLLCFSNHTIMNPPASSRRVSPHRSLRSPFGDNPPLAESSFACRFIPAASRGVFAASQIKMGRKYLTKVSKYAKFMAIG